MIRAKALHEIHFHIEHGRWLRAFRTAVEAVVQTYNTKQSLGLTTARIADLAQYLKLL